MSVSNLSVRDADYLVAVKSCGKRPAKISEIAEMLGVAKSTASLMMKKLMIYGLVEKAGRGYVLSKEGEDVVRNIIWRHLVVEAALVSIGLTPNEACRAARLIELSLPQETVEKIWELLGKPTMCPHGNKITGSFKICRPVR